MLLHFYNSQRHNKALRWNGQMLWIRALFYLQSQMCNYNDDPLFLQVDI